MSYLVCHIEKYKKHQIVPIGNHNNRVSDKHSNLDIDPELKEKNFDARSGEEGNPTVDYMQRVKDIMDEGYKVKKPPRQNAVMMVGIVVSSDQAFFHELNIEEIKRFFKEASFFLIERYGENNVIDAKVHMDETTPHMHFEFVPLLKDGRLCARELFDSFKLRILQTDFSKYLQDKHFDITRGIELSGTKHIPIPELKRQTLRAVHDYEVQTVILKAVSGDIKDLKKFVVNNGQSDKFGKLIENITIFIENYMKMVYDSVYYIRKKRENEDIIARLSAERTKLTDEKDALVKKYAKAKKLLAYYNITV